MKIKRFIIENYRAAERIELSLRSSITPIVGVNESGKSTTLQALHAFDKGRDSFGRGGKHLEFQNRYSNKETTNCKIRAVIEFNDQDRTEILSNFPTTVRETDRERLQATETGSDFEFSRHLTSEKKQYILEGDTLTEPAKRVVTKHIKNNLPAILYFDDFSDRVPEEIVFPTEYKKGEKLKTRGVKREWQELVREVFRRADAEGLDDDDDSTDPLLQFLNVEDADRRDGMLSDVEDTLSSEIIDDWKSLRAKGSKNLADDAEDLQLKLINGAII